MACLINQYFQRNMGDKGGTAQVIFDKVSKKIKIMKGFRKGDIKPNPVYSST